MLLAHLFAAMFLTLILIGIIIAMMGIVGVAYYLADEHHPAWAFSWIILVIFLAVFLGISLHGVT
jgi:uncharacterized membrane protein HdeD (DUF308 family)